MTSRELPVLGLAFRRYPTKRDQQHYDDPRGVCGDCLSGACCESEGPIYLTSLDVFRLAAFFNIAPAAFLSSFTQERFSDDPSGEIRRSLIDDPNCSIVTFLRRRDEFPASPCIFLKYVRDPDRTPRRICTVYSARPLACREFYFDTCKKRVTGELAALLAEGYEKVRDGEIVEERVDAELARFSEDDVCEATLSQNMEIWFWGEMKRALNTDQVNVEGSNSYDMSDFQDPIDERLNRVLSAKHVRFEERYGPKPRGDQVTPYTEGLTFAGSGEWQRMMTIVRQPPSSELYALRGNEVGVGVRTLVKGAKHAEFFPAIPGAEVSRFLSEIPVALLFPHHDTTEIRAVTLRDAYRAVLRGYNHLIRFASYIAEMDDVPEGGTPGEFESELLAMIAGLETSLNPFLARNPYFEPVKHHMAEATLSMLERQLAESLPPKNLFVILRLLFGARAAVRTFSPKLRTRFQSVAQVVESKLEKDMLDLYVPLENPVHLRRRSGRRLTAAVWLAWREQVLDVRYAAEAGFGPIDLADFYEQSIEDLENFPFRRGNVDQLCRIIVALARSMSFHNTIAYQDMSYKGAARRLSDYLFRLVNWIGDLQDLDCEVIAELASVYKALGLGYNQDPSFGVIIRRVLDSQLPDGSWKTDPLPEDTPVFQEDYLRTMYRATWTCVDALRPLRSDVLSTENAHLGLI